MIVMILMVNKVHFGPASLLLHLYGDYFRRYFAKSHNFSGERRLVPNIGNDRRLHHTRARIVDSRINGIHGSEVAADDWGKD